MSEGSQVKALVFDVFGTVVDWRSSLIADFTKWADGRGLKADWTALVDAWLRDNARFAILTVTESQMKHFCEIGFTLQRIGPGEDNSIMVCLSREPLPGGGLFARLLAKLSL